MQQRREDDNIGEGYTLGDEESACEQMFIQQS